MKQYQISSTATLPDGNHAVGTTVVEIPDHHIAALKAFIDTLGTIDVGELDLENEMPVLYDTLYDACEEATMPAVEAYYLRKFFHEGKVGYDVDEAMQACWDEGIYSMEAGVDNDMYEEDPDQALQDRDTYNRIYFEDWLSGYINSLGDEELTDFMARILDFEMEDLGDWEFTVEVPDKFKR